MRMIDADALKANMFDYAPPEMMWDRGDIEHKIEEMPTIDAIPVDWLRQVAMKDDGLINSVIRGLLMKWQKEQEAR